LCSACLAEFSAHHAKQEDGGAEPRFADGLLGGGGGGGGGVVYGGGGGYGGCGGYGCGGSSYGGGGGGYGCDGYGCQGGPVYVYQQTTAGGGELV
jgi:hypothetical protein